jgi:CheY-like chemotaxis protein
MASMDKDTFRVELETALTHLRDVVRLRTMDLAAALLPDLSHVERGWGLSRYLLSAIEELKPLAADRGYWGLRRYQLLTLRYANSLSVADICAEVAIGERHCYRQLQRALDELAEHIWVGKLAPEPSEGADRQPAASASLQTLLERETEQLQGGAQRAQPGEALEGAYHMIAPVATRRGTRCNLSLADNMPVVGVAPEILRQFLLGLLGSLITMDGVKRLTVSTHVLGERLSVAARAEGSFSSDLLRRLDQTGPLEGSLGGLARMQGIELLEADLKASAVRYAYTLPVAGDRTVLVVDDNADVRLLLRRYLIEGGYSPLLADTGESGLRLAQTTPLYAIILDLMMSHEDGWDVLQTLGHDPHTSGIPVVVCSVLNQRDLALLLGASRFLQKPVMCEHLLATLEDLAASPAQGHS